MKQAYSFRTLEDQDKLNEFLKEHRFEIPFSTIYVGKDVVTVNLETDPRYNTRITAGESTYNEYYRNYLLQKANVEFWTRMKLKKEIAYKRETNNKDLEKELQDIDSSLVSYNFQMLQAQEQMEFVDQEMKAVKRAADIKLGLIIPEQSEMDADSN